MSRGRPKGSKSDYTTSPAVLAQRQGAAITRRREGFNDEGNSRKAIIWATINPDTNEVDPELLSVYKEALTSTLQNPLVNMAREFAELKTMIHQQRKKDHDEGMVFSREFLQATKLSLEMAKLHMVALEAKQRNKGRDHYANHEDLEKDLTFQVSEEGEVVDTNAAVRLNNNFSEKKQKDGDNDVANKQS